MNKAHEQATKILMGTIKEIMQDSKYVHLSSVDTKYTELKEPGKEMITETVALILPLLAKAQQDQQREDAENLMMSKLSK